MKLNPGFFLLLLFFLSACSGSQEGEANTQTVEMKGMSTQEVEPVWNTPANALVASLEEAHKVAAFRGKKAIAFDLKLTFGGKLRMDARITTSTGSERVRIDRADGTTLLYYQEEGYMMPADADWKNARFDLLTWQYFAMAPFKLTDPGTQWELLPDAMEEGKAYARGKLSFSPNVGDAPDDWYVAYQDKDSKMLTGLAYIVTYRADQEEAEKNPKAILYSNYIDIDGIPFASRWEFWKWDEENGFSGPARGEATLSNIEFVDPEPGFFRPNEQSAPIPRRQI